MKRVISCAVALLLFLTMATTANATDESGGLSKAEIKQLLDSTQFDTSGGLWCTAPQLSSYTAGQLSEDMQVKALARFNAWRKIAGLSEVSLKKEYSELSQHGAFIQAVIGNGLFHYPAQPSGMPDAFYQKAYAGASKSNLAAGMQFPDVVDRLLSDELGKNLTSVGHRRWFLNTAMAYTGFGYAENLDTPYKRYTAVYAIDNAEKAFSRDYTTWPVSGNFPGDTQAFQCQTPWSIQLNAKSYGKVDPKDVTVILTRASDGTSWTFDGNKTYKVSETDDYFTVDNTKIGGTIAIIFRPGNVSAYSGLWSVNLHVAKTSTGKSFDLQYSVDFFDTQSYTPASDSVDVTTSSVLLFEDVPDKHWAKGYIAEAMNDGAVVGVSPNRFNPEDPLTAYEFATMLLRGSLKEEVPTKGLSPWYASVDLLSDSFGLWDGIQGIDKSIPLSRNDMSVMIYNLLRYVGVNVDPNALSVFSDVSDPLYCLTVGVCTNYDILQGVTGTEFGGESGVTRAQAAAVYCRLKSVLDIV